MDIQLRNLSIGYRHGKSCSVVMQNIDAEIKPGRLTCLIGSNGAGKSTLLRTISAFQPKLGGEIMLGDREIAEYSREELARIIGVVLTERPQVQNLTVFQMAAMGRSPYTGFFGRLDEEDKKIVAESLDGGHKPSRRPYGAYAERRRTAEDDDGEGACTADFGHIPR